jgi:HEAT repeats
MVPDFQPYLNSICTDYAQWWQLYTLTDAAGKQRQAQEVAPTFDFGLMVQTVKREERQQEKVERFTVLEGMRKYADQQVLLIGRPGSGKSTALARLMLELAQELLPQVRSQNPIVTPRSLTHSESQRLEQRRSDLQTEWNQQNEKLSRLRQARAIETQAAVQFQLEQQIKGGESAIAQLNDRLSGIEQTLSSGTTLQSSFDGQIPVLVELRAWQTSIFDLICKACKRHGLNLTISQIETMLDDQQLLLLIDGVNELPSEAARTDVFNFRRNYPKVPMIFTTRELSLGGDLGIEQKLEMQPLTEDQMQAFVRSYVPDQAEQMLRQLKDRLQEFGQTPLLLWMLCGLFDKTGSIPENLGMVFRLFTQGYERNLKRDVVVESDRAWWKPVLQQLAWVMMQEEKPTELRVAIREKEAVKEIAQFMQGKVPYAEDFARKCLRDLQRHHLIQTSTTPEELEFRHQLIQEYYAAEALLEQLPQLPDLQLQQTYLNFLKWTEPVALMLALVNEEAQAVQVVKLGLSVDRLFGSRLAGEVKPEFQGKTVKFVEGLELSEWLQFRCLEVTRSEHTIPGLLKRLEDDDSDVRGSAAEALGEIGSADAIPGLLKRLEHADSNVRWSNVRWSAAYTLGKIAKDHADTIAPHLPYLLTLIPTDSGKDAYRAILAIQANCKYYNYEIYQAYLKAEDSDRTSPNRDRTPTAIAIQHGEITIMTNQPPIFNQQNATIGVNYAAEGSNNTIHPAKQSHRTDP